VVGAKADIPLSAQAVGAASTDPDGISDAYIEAAAFALETASAPSEATTATYSAFLFIMLLDLLKMKNTNTPLIRSYYGTL
jgi:hypothetical protein